MILNNCIMKQKVRCSFTLNCHTRDTRKRRKEKQEGGEGEEARGVVIWNKTQSQTYSWDPGYTWTLSSVLSYPVSKTVKEKSCLRRTVRCMEQLSAEV